ncbi:hypothetical protein LguiB_007234 [Lonicera macranthoides]
MGGMGVCGLRFMEYGMMDLLWYMAVANGGGIAGAGSGCDTVMCSLELGWGHGCA